MSAVRGLWFAATIATTVGCVARDPHSVEADTSFAPESIRTIGDQRTFGIDSALRVMYLPYLRNMREPPMESLAGSTGVESVRFVWLRSFHHPIAVRVTRRGSRFSLVAAELGDETDMKPGRLIKRDSVEISESQWNSVVHALRQPDFWDPAPLGGYGVDGSIWIVESTSGRGYQVVDVWSPEENGRGAEIRALGIRMLSMAKMMPTADVY